MSSVTYRVSDEKARLRDTFLAAYWDYDAPCKQAPDLWHSAELATRNIAKRECLKCDLLEACDAWASADPPERTGVWGGKDRASRATKRVPVSAQRTCGECGEVYRARNDQQRYCMPDCSSKRRKQAYEQRKKEQRWRKP